jgi:acyl carrier protein
MDHRTILLPETACQLAPCRLAAKSEAWNRASKSCVSRCEFLASARTLAQRHKMTTPTSTAILDAIASEISIDPTRLKPDVELASLDLSSLDFVSALFAIEDQCGVELSPEEAATATTLQDLIGMVQAKAPAA